MSALSTRVSRVAAAMVALVLGVAARAGAQAEIKVSDDVNVRFGFNGHLQYDTITEPGTDERTTNLFARRVEIYFAGQVAQNVTFFVETLAPNLGKTLPSGKNITPSPIIQDGYAELQAATGLIFDAGLLRVPFSRNGLQGTSTFLVLDYGPYTFDQGTVTLSSTGRDTGVQARGYVWSNRLEYRAGVFQGARDAQSDNALRYAGRVQLNVFEPITTFLYAGTYLGTKKVLSFGAAFDRQSRYRGYDVDAFAEIPAGPGALTGQVDVTRFDGGPNSVTLPKENTALVELGYLVRAWHVTPVLQFARRGVVDTEAGDERRTSLGATYWLSGNNVNIRGVYTHVKPHAARAQHEVTVQLQVFYF